MKSVWVKIILCMTIAFLFVGCSTQSSMSDEEIVRKRAQERLNALVAQDYEKAYSYASPGYRAGVSAGAHFPKFAGAGSWTKGIVKEVTCAGDVCDVKTSISYTLLRLNLTNTRPMSQRWIKVDGKWWIYHK